MKIDGKAIVNGVWLPLVVWAAAVLLVGVVNHQPGVVCMTPSGVVNGPMGWASMRSMVPQY
ncbi:MAG: hypothetical protein QOH96_2932 [Blastocatellia bacterium]|jgi:hypothetical protein|nr:hypothetical protein [Blastocatellia bacterium]